MFHYTISIICIIFFISCGIGTVEHWPIHPKSANVLIIDKNPPIITLTSVSNWQKTDAIPSLTCLDEDSGCNLGSFKYMFYDSDPGPCSTTMSDYSASVTVTTHKWVCAAAQDNAGNEGFTDTAQEFKIDEINPTAVTTIDDGSTSTSTTQSPLISWSGGGTDAESGFLRYEFSVGSSAGLTDIKSWTSNDTNTTIAAITGLNLTAGNTYIQVMIIH